MLVANVLLRLLLLLLLLLDGDKDMVLSSC
jgi:hypothetical protein